IHENAFHITDQVTTRVDLNSRALTSSNGIMSLSFLNKFKIIDDIGIKFNNVELIPSGLFDQFKNSLQVLYLSGPSLKFIEEMVFSSLIHLERITITST